MLEYQENKPKKNLASVFLKRIFSLEKPTFNSVNLLLDFKNSLTSAGYGGVGELNSLKGQKIKPSDKRVTWLFYLYL